MRRSIARGIIYDYTKKIVDENIYRKEERACELYTREEPSGSIDAEKPIGREAQKARVEGRKKKKKPRFALLWK